MKSKTIPTILGLLTIIITTVLGGYGIEKIKGPINVNAQEKPLSIKITNITDHSFTVSWYTQSPTSGYVKIDGLNQLFSDQRDQDGNQTNSHLTHYVVIDSLRPKTRYSFTIFSAGKPYRDNTLQTQTAPSNSAFSPEADLAFGVILDQHKRPLPGAIVFLSIANASPLSSITNASGNWSISLGTAYKKDLSGFINYDKNNQIIELTVIAAPNLSATATTNTANDHPVPPIIIGRTYNFSVQPKLSPPPQSSSTPLTESTRIPTIHPSPKVSISNPKEGEILTNTKPEFKGFGPAKKTVHLTIESSTAYNAEVAVGPDGSWDWTPPQNLEPGEHTITLKYTDENNQLQSLVHHFIVRAAETVSPTPTPITFLPTQITPTPTTTPTVIPTPTLSPTASPTATVAPKKTVGTQAAQIISGNLTPFLLLAMVGIILIGVAVAIA